MWLYRTALALLAATVLAGPLYGLAVRHWPLRRTFGVGLYGAGLTVCLLAVVFWLRGMTRDEVTIVGVLVGLLSILRAARSRGTSPPAGP